MKKRVLILCAAAISMAACKNGKFAGYETTKNGLMYKIIKHGSGRKAAVGDIVLFGNASMTMKDSLLAPPAPNASLRVAKVSKKADPNELFTLLSQGDSASFLISIDSAIGKGGTIPKPFKKGDYFKVGIKINKIMTESEFKSYTAHLADSIKEAHAHELTDYIAKNNLDAKGTAEGLYYVIEKPGTGANIADGKKVKVKYKGYLTNGEVFDKGDQPIDLEIGKHMVIPGWEMGLKMFKKGGKGKLIIPSALGYGDRGAGNQIPPNATLVFDVEILDVN